MFILNLNLDVIFAQENGTVNKDKLQLSNMKTVHDTNNATNRGAVLYVHDTISCTALPEISKVSKQIDSAWGLAIVKKKKYIVGSVYVKLK